MTEWIPSWFHVNQSRPSHLKLVSCVFWQKRLAEARILVAGLVHLKGLGLSLWRSMKARMSACRCLTEV